MFELHEYNKDSGQMKMLEKGSAGHLRKKMNILRLAGGKKAPNLLIYGTSGELHCGTFNGGANPHIWGIDRDGRKKGQGRKNINL